MKNLLVLVGAAFLPASSRPRLRTSSSPTRESSMAPAKSSSAAPSSSATARSRRSRRAIPPRCPARASSTPRGMTVMPGFIDAHRHPIPANTAEWLEKNAAAEMQAFLDAGFTTVLSAITPDEGLELRRRTESGAVKGPRIFAAAIIPLGAAPAAAADAERAAADAAAIRRASTTRGRRCVRPSRPARFPPRTRSRRSRPPRRPASTTSRP